MRASIVVACAVVAAVVLACLPGHHAQAAEISAESEYARRIKIWETIQPHGETPFGEQINLYTGALSFRQTDAVLEGTGPAIPLVRSTLSLMSGTKIDKPYAFGNWTLSIPRIETLVDKDQGWFIAAVAADKYKRCSQFDRPWYPTMIEGGWFGIDLVDGTGHRQQLLQRSAANTQKPAMTDGAGAPMAFPIVTQEHWQVACLPNTSNGVVGEAFLAVDPAGTKYYFDHLVYDPADTLTETDMGTILRQRRALATMFVSKIVDRFGNSVAFQYGGDDTLDAIVASDGREVAIRWRTDARLIDHIIVQPSAPNPRTWRYEYTGVTAAGGVLSGVVLPDGSRWAFHLQGVGGGGLTNNALRKCGTRTLANGATPYVTTVTAPSGLTGTFETTPIWHGRSLVPSACLQPPNQDPFEDMPPLFGATALVKKQFSGIGVPLQTWTYAYAPAVGSTTSDSCSGAGTCATTKWVSVVGGDGNKTVYTFSNRWGPTEGKLLQVDQYQGTSGGARRTETFAYASHAQGPWPATLGYGFDDARSNASTKTTWTPQVSRTVQQQGRQFTSQVASFDAFANPLKTTRSSNVGSGYTRTDTITYDHNLGLWVIGQVSASTNADTGLVESRVVFDAATALPRQTFAFGKLQQTRTYDADGNLASASDGRDTAGYDTTITFGEWKRGIPRKITFPDGHSKAARVDDLGMIESVDDEAGNRTCHAFDAMGRLAKVTYPSGTTARICDESKWNPMVRTFSRSTAAEFGLAAGHWKEHVATGNGHRVTHYDALWRPVVVERFDSGNKAATWTQSVTRYTPEGAVAFQSYPLSTLADHATVNVGTRTTYDTLGRPTRVEQDSEHGTLVTQHEYLTGLHTRTTTPGADVTTTTWRAYDAPEDAIAVAIAHPEGAFTTITHDVFGKPLTLVRHAAGGAQAVTRSYAYDGTQALCRRSEPETGATLLGHDAAGNLAWTAAGLPATTPCETDGQSAAVAARKSVRTYDNRNRLTTLAFADGIGEQTWTYTPDGLPAAAWHYNGANRTVGVYKAYTYDGRRNVASEMSHQPGWYSWTATYGHDRNGFRTSQTFPDTSGVNYAVNALGQVTGITGTSGTYVSDARYAPNGALRQFTFGNGIVHTLEQNVRGFTDRSRDAHGGVAVVDDSYDYDFNGNVAAISDGLPGAAGNRTMTYDGRDRLTSSAAPAMFGGTIHYTYDVQDNIATLARPATPALRYCYNAANQLQFLRSGATNCSNGAALHALDFDPQGNLFHKDDRTFSFGQDNRLRSVVGQEYFRYDAHGLRVVNWSPTLGNIVSFYSQDGQLALRQDQRTGWNIAYVHLAGRLVMTREHPMAGGPATLKFHHTDALGTPVALTDLQRNVIERTRHEPYGKPLQVPRDAAGYTGHVEDAQTGLTYMQQRYYDPGIGRFMSADPVAPDGSDGRNFNRYWYANANPHRFTDPDGRLAFLAVPIVFGIGALLHSGPANAPAPGDVPEQMSPAEAMAVAVPAARFAAPLRVAADAAGVSQRAAGREAKRQIGIPTSQQPISQSNGRTSDGTPVGRQQTYEIAKPHGATQMMSVQVSRDTRGEHAGMPQVEAGAVKPFGQSDPGGRPRIQNVDKVRVDFDPAL